MPAAILIEQKADHGDRGVHAMPGRRDAKRVTIQVEGVYQDQVIDPTLKLSPKTPVLDGSWTPPPVEKQK